MKNIQFELQGYEGKNQWKNKIKVIVTSLPKNGGQNVKIVGGENEKQLELVGKEVRVYIKNLRKLEAQQNI